MNRETTREAKLIAAKLASAIAHATIFGPEALRQAIKEVQALNFSVDEDEQETVAAFVRLLERSADRKEANLRETFGKVKS